jgi:hypothetical protein
MKHTSRIAIALLLAGFSACATVKARLENIPLIWKPTSEIDLPPGTVDTIVGTKIEFDVFKDVRQQPEMIAQNLEDAVSKPVTTRDNVGQFVRTHVREAFYKAGLNTVDSDGDVIITGEIRQFFVDETTIYKGTVLLRLNVQNHAGEKLWSGVASGTAKRFGHSYSAENYYEVLSDSVLNAISSLLRDVEFRKALAQK